MNIKPVDIEIDDKRKFAEVAFLVDKDDFLIELVEKRRELNLKELIPYSKVETWQKHHLDQTLKKQPIRIWKNDERKTINYFVPQIKSELIVHSLLQKYHRDNIFYFAVEYALLCGKVTNKEFESSAYCAIIHPDTQSEAKLAIVISPDTKWQELKKIYDEDVPKLAEEYRKRILKSGRTAPDTISNIKRDREWYWLHKNGLSYWEIEKQWSLNNNHLTRDAIIKAIKRYEYNLATDI